MAWRFVQQPNGLIALFSEIVDDFTYYNLSETDAVEICIREYGMTEQESREKYWRGMGDELMLSYAGEPFGPPDRLRRWRKSLAIIERVHGMATANSRETIMTAGPLSRLGSTDGPFPTG